MFTVYIRTTRIPFDTAGLTHDHDRLPDELQFVKYSSMTWTHDSKGFFYQVSPNFRSIVKFRCSELFLKRYPAKESRHSHGESHAMLCYHRIGTPQCKPIHI